MNNSMNNNMNNNENNNEIHDIKLKDIEYIINTMVNQIIFENAIGEVEYHPEREMFLTKYFFMKYAIGYNFNNDFDCNNDMFGLEFYQDMYDEMESQYDSDKYDYALSKFEYLILDSVYKKVEFKKSMCLKNSHFGLTDVCLADLISKVSDVLDKEGIQQFLDVINKTGEELGSKDV